MSFWEKTNQQPSNGQDHSTDALRYSTANIESTISYDEQAVAEIQGDPNLDLGDEEEDLTEIMADANLRLEMGRLYQMIMRHDLFGDTDADPKATRIVQREIRKLVREKMEVMLGIRQELATPAAVVSSPFNDLEVQALKMLASKVTKGATEQQPASEPVAPKKDGITAVSGNLRANNRPLPLPPSLAASNPGKPSPAPKQKTQPKVQHKSTIVEEASALQKPIDQMTQEELMAYNQAAAERHAKKKAAVPNNLQPHPTPQQLEALYTVVATNHPISLSANRFRPYE